MNKKFSKSWISSKQPRKQRKYAYNAPISIKRTFLGCGLSKALKNIYHKRSIKLHIGDRVKVLRGENAGKTGEITKISLKDTKVYVDGIVTKKSTGTEVQVPMHPSNMQITEINDKDIKREKAIKKTPAKNKEKKIDKKE